MITAIVWGILLVLLGFILHDSQEWLERHDAQHHAED